MPYGPPQPVESDPASIFDDLMPLTPPMIVSRILFSLGFTFRWGAVRTTEPLLQKRLVLHDVHGGSVRLLGGEPVRAVGSDDLVVPTDHMLPIGVDQAIGNALGLRG